MDSISFSWDGSVFAGVPTEVTRFRLESALNEPYEAIVELRLEDPDADVAQLLGADGAITIERLPTVHRVAGVITEVWEGHGHEGRGETESMAVRVRLAPALRLLELRRSTRVFQDKTVPQILEDVLGAGLGAYGRSLTLDLSRAYPTREYCVQYQESDLDFAQRLMEEEGIFYAFDHEGEKEEMILRDANAACSRAPSPSDPIAYQADNLHATDAEVIVRADRVHRSTTTAVTVRDWDWTAGGDMVVEATADGQDALGRTREGYEHGGGRSLTISSYDEGARRYQAEDSTDQARLRQEALLAEAVTVVGVGRVVGFRPGTSFELAGHPTLGLDGAYLLTRVVHESAPAPGGGGDGDEVEPYHNRFECVPVATPFRPRRQATKPRIDGIQTALVTGPSGEEIHVDEHGRIKVQFFWDRESPADETSSCWVRCEQDWAGAGWGFWWVPRIGMEVVVQFIDGDPDRPIVTGCVYNAACPLPYPLPDEKTKSTIKSNSSPGGGGFNELRFEDKAGSEEIFAHAQKDYDEVVENDHTTTVHHDQTNEVDNDQTQTIHQNQTERVDVDQVMTIGGNRTVHVEGNFDETVDGTETRHTVGDVTETFLADETRTVTGDVTEDVGGSETRTIGAGQTESIGASHSQTISGASTVTIGGSRTLDVTGAITSNTPASQTLIAAGGMNATVAGVTKWVADGGVTFLAPGGYTFIDVENDWVGQFLVKWAPVDQNVIGIKVETGGTSAGYAAFNVAAYLLCMNFRSEWKEEDGVYVAGTPFEADTGTKLNFIGVKFMG